MGVEFNIVDQVATVTIDRPERMNAVDGATDTALEAIWLRIEADRNIRCVVLTGAGDRAFSAGADMKSASEHSGLAYWGNGNPNGFGGIALRQTLDVPVIARVNGLAMGGGFEMVLGCDIVVAADHARFSLPEARVGRLPLEGGMVMLQRQIPHRVAMGYLLTGRQLSANDALEYGLVNQVVALDQLDTAIDQWVADIKACAPLSVRAIKHVAANTGHLAPHHAQAVKSQALIDALQSADSEEGVLAFREKRPPRWTGT